MYTQHRTCDKKIGHGKNSPLKRNNCNEIQRDNLQVKMEDAVWPALLQPTLFLFDGNTYTLLVSLFRHCQQNIFVKTQLPPVDGLELFFLLGDEPDIVL